MRPGLCRRSFSSPLNFNPTKAACRAAFVLAALLAALPSIAQQPAPPEPALQAKTGPPSTVTIPAGTRLALVLTQPIQSRYIHRGDDIYAQINAPVDAGNELVIPAGTFVQGTVDKIGRDGSRGELHLQSLSITFPDGYIAPIAGPITLESNEGYAIRDPGHRRMAEAFILPAAGVGIGALIGHSVGSSNSTQSSLFPPGCTGPPPFCTTTSTPVFGTKGRDTVIGAGVGGAIGMFAAFGFLFSSHHFYIDAGAPVDMTLQQPVTLQQNEVAEAVRRSLEHPVYQQPVAPRPIFIPPVDAGPPPGMPGNPGTPPTVIPGPPGPDGIPGPPIVIPGTPPS